MREQRRFVLKELVQAAVERVFRDAADLCAEQVAHRDQDEEVLHAGARSQGIAAHVVRGHAVDDLPEGHAHGDLHQTGVVHLAYQ